MIRTIAPTADTRSWPQNHPETSPSRRRGVGKKAPMNEPMIPTMRSEDTQFDGGFLRDPAARQPMSMVPIQPDADAEIHGGGFHLLRACIDR